MTKPKPLSDRDRIMALLSPPSQDVYLCVKDARWIADEIKRLRDALRPFAKVYQSADPYRCVTLPDLRVAYNVLSRCVDDSTPAQEQTDE